MPTPSTSSPAHEEQAIALSEFGPDMTGRSLGEQVRGSVSSTAIAVIFDCEGVEAMSPSFADEVFGKLAAQPKRPLIRLVNASPEVLDAVRFAVQQRTAEP